MKGSGKEVMIIALNGLMKTGLTGQRAETMTIALNEVRKSEVKNHYIRKDGKIKGELFPPDQYVVDM